MAGNAVTRGVPRQLLQGTDPSVAAVGAGQIPTIQYSTGSARALQQFSRDMFSLSSQFEDQADAQAEAEAKTKGALAGVSGDVELQDYGTIRGRAYNQAAIETFAATIETKSIIQLQELQTKFASDPEALKAGIDNWTKGAVTEVSKFDPAAGVALQQRMAIRGAPAIEAAKDYAFKLTKDQADAALIENEMALKAEIKNNAMDLFSENPDRSRAAARSIGMVQNEYMKIYTAKDPTTGRPLYTAEEVAKAKKAFTSTVMTQATLSWFDGQPDKAAAYLKFSTGDFKIKMNSVGGTAKVIMANQGATRNDPIQPALRQQVSAAASALGDGIDVQVHSGGQETVAEVRAGIGSRTGSPRHDHGGAGDMRLVQNGKVLNVADNRELYLKFAENLAAAGVEGIGIDERKGYIHAGGGGVASWGYGGRNGGVGSKDFLPADFGAAIERGRKGERLESKPTSSEFNVRDALPESALNSLEEEMRSRITFNNTQFDRRDKQEKEELKARQDLNAFDLTARMFGQGEPLDQRDIVEAVRTGVVDPDKGAAIAKALATERPEKSDPTTYRRIMADMYAGNDVYQDVLRAGDKLTNDDMAQILGKNQSLNSGSEKNVFTKEQKFQFDLLDEQLLPKGTNMLMDDRRVDRAVEAKDEFRRRVTDPENTETPDQIRADIVSRAKYADAIVFSNELNGMVRPRFSVQVQGATANRLDIEASITALTTAFEAKQISETEYNRELMKLQQWDTLQTQIDEAETARQQKVK